MKNKLFIAVVTFISIAFFSMQELSAQISKIESHASSNWIGVTSYNGVTKNDAFTFAIILPSKDINYPNWSLAVKVSPPITNGQTTITDFSKISIRINQVSGGPSLADLNAHQTFIPLSDENQIFFKSVNYPLYHGPTDYYSRYVFIFDVNIAGGSYLERLKSNNNQYPLTLTFSVLDENNIPLTAKTPLARMRIYPEDTPPSEPTYGIQVNSNARNGLLEFKTITDYVNGVSQTYQNGLSVTSNTGYAVQVRSLKTNFEAGTHTLPVSAVSLEIKDPNNSAVGGTISLSGIDQTVFNATNSGTQPRPFNLRYFTQPNDERMLNAKPASYETTLVYTLAPQ